MIRKKASVRAVAVAKIKGKEEVVVRTRGMRRTRMNPGETPTLRQGGQKLSPLVVTKVLCLRAALKRNLNNNKEANVPMKMDMSLVPTSSPAWCGWCGNFARKGLTLPFVRRSDKEALGGLQIWFSGYVSV